MAAPDPAPASVPTGRALAVERLVEAGRSAPAAALCAQWIADDPVAHRPHGLLAAIEGRRGAWTEALGHLDRAIERAPALLRYQIDRGAVLRRMGDTEGALQAFERVLAAAPDDGEAIGQYGLTLLKLGEDARAAEMLTRANAAMPERTGWRLALAVIASRSGDPDRAAALLGHVIEQAPDDLDALDLRSQVALDLGDYASAVDCMQRAAQIDPSSHERAGRLALTLLQAGRLAEGWAQLRSRLDVPGRDRRARLFPHPVWDGGSLRGRTIALWRQFGIGEEIMFAGMLPDVLAEGGRAVVECDPRLLPLYRRSLPEITFVPFQGALATPRPELLDPRIACKAALADLGGRYRHDLGRFPARRSYLSADPVRAAALTARRRDDGARPAIGIVWHSERSPASPHKSIPLAAWRPAFAAIEATWFDLQHGEPPDGHPADVGVPLRREPDVDTQNDLDGLAALIASLDLVVTISTATAHLAGALGKEAFVLVPARRGLLWHWFDGRDDSPWYPSVRLFRQRRDGDWSEAMVEVANALSGWRARRPGPS
ncbi:MAG: tetratricopeptide repeat protein [Alphaproteobacteria bacterium]